MAAKPKPSKSVNVERAKANAAKAKPSKAAVAKPAAAANTKLRPVKSARATGSQGKPAVAVETYFVSLAPLKPLIYNAAPTTGAKSVEFSSFASARDRAIEQLIEFIEDVERRLHFTRHAATFAEYQRSLRE